MINLDEFDGHTPGPWQEDGGGWISTYPGDMHIGSVRRFSRDASLLADSKLLAAAPKLLAEVIRLRSDLSALKSWRQMQAAPKDGEAVMVLLAGSDVPHAARWLDAGHKFAVNGAGWHIVWDLSPVASCDGPRYWMPIPDSPAGQEGGAA
jgi:hypothetical protein